MHAAVAMPQFLSGNGGDGRGGEVIVLDSGGYGGVTITQSVSIISPSGVYAGVSGFTGAAIDVNAPNGYVSLRGLVLNGQGGTTGIKVENAITAHIENVLVTGFTANGIEVVGDGAIFVEDSIIRNCAGGSGVLVAPPGLTYVTIDNTRLEYDGWGMVADSGAKVTMRNSLIAFSVHYGVLFRNTGMSGTPYGTIEHVVVSDTLGFCDGCLLCRRRRARDDQGQRRGSAAGLRLCGG